MPIYEYRCSSCGHKLESLQKFSDAPLRSCPSCHGETLVKLVSAAGFQLKGSGWYATDFKGSGAKPAAKSGAESSRSADGKSESRAESSKSESTTESGSGSKSEAKPESKSAATSDPKTSTAATGTGTTTP